MRKFIISDIHGFGNLYYAIMGYLENISKKEEVELYINGDLIDRGNESAEILLDVIKRIKENKIKITYLGGNHELLMYNFFEDLKKKKANYNNLWYQNGGIVTDNGLQELVKDSDKIYEIANFIGNLKIYQKFEEKIKQKPIVLVHSACPIKIKNNCNLTIKKNNDAVYYAVETREYDPLLPFKCRIGHDKYFTIIGHTPVIYPEGYDFIQESNYINIDGGCAAYVTGDKRFNHFPLVEVCDGFLKILTFNDNNEIIYGNFFDGNKSIPYSEIELKEAREPIDNKVKIKKISFDNNKKTSSN